MYMWAYSLGPTSHPPSLSFQACQSAFIFSLRLLYIFMKEKEGLFEVCQFDNYVTAIKPGDPLSGGHGAPINLQAANINNRLLYLKYQLENIPKFLRYSIGREKDACGSLLDELNYLAETKELLKRALQAKHLPVTDATPLRAYPEYLHLLLTSTLVKGAFDSPSVVIHSGGYLSIKACIDIPSNNSLEVPI